MNQEFIWANTDFPFMCLLDKERTLAFQKAIEAAVKPGDTVVDVGSGSGILALFAARAGAGTVYAVEMDHTLVESLQKTVAANGFGDVIEVVEGDGMEVNLPKDVDVVVAELIDTGLIDEMQVPVMNRLRRDGIVTDKTILIPSAYTTFIEPIHSSQQQYGFTIFAPHHDWPFFHDSEKSSWSDTSFDSLAERQEICHLDLSKHNDTELSASRRFTLSGDKPMTGLRLSGTVWLNKNTPLGATNTLNSDKVFIIDPLEPKGAVAVDIGFDMGRGMESLKFTCRGEA